MDSLKAITDRKLRKAVIHEYLYAQMDENIGRKVSKVMIADTCTKLIEAIQDIQKDPDDPEKYAEDSELDHWDSFG